MNQSNSLQNLDNYKTKLSCSTTDILIKYTNLITEYMQFGNKNIFVKNGSYYNFILYRGLETITHVFNLLLLFTKNIDLTYYHCQKSFYYYIEFIGQIGDDYHSFLQLSSKDATLFVYKKTIFDINTDIYRNSNPTSIPDHVSLFIEINNNIYSKIINTDITIINTNYIIINKLFENIINLSLNENKDSTTTQYILIKFFVQTLNNIELKCTAYIYIIECFINKINKKKITLDLLKSKIYTPEFKQLLKTTSSTKAINWIFH